MTTKRWEVLTRTEFDGFVNCWQVNEEPQTFASEEEAEAEVLRFILDCQDAVVCGDMEDAPTREDFMVCEVTP